jgi:uncharacterized protein (TIGR00661 family)
MKYMFIVEGEGRGHLTQAISLYQMLIRNGDEVLEVLVGRNKSLTLPAFFQEKIQAPISSFNSSCFLFSPKSKKTLFLKSVFYNLWKSPDYIKSIRFIKKRIDESDACMVINFYEVLTGLTYAFTRPKIPYICIAHQYLFFHPDFVFPGKSKLQLAGLLLFTRLTCLRAARLLALSFRELKNTGNIHVTPPLMRKEVLQQEPVEGDYILGYMIYPGVSEQVLEWHHNNRHISLHFYWDKIDAPEELPVDENLTFHQLNDVSFLQHMAGCKAYASTGGFESICEALYLQKPVMMVPLHIEQECNAFDAANAGAGISSSEFNLSNLLEFLPDYSPDTTFADWVNKSSFLFLKELRIANEREESNTCYTDKLSLKALLSVFQLKPSLKIPNGF